MFLWDFLRRLNKIYIEIPWHLCNKQSTTKMFRGQKLTVQQRSCSLSYRNGSLAGVSARPLIACIVRYFWSYIRCSWRSCTQKHELLHFAVDILAAKAFFTGKTLARFNLLPVIRLGKRCIYAVRLLMNCHVFGSNSNVRLKFFSSFFRPPLLGWRISRCNKSSVVVLFQCTRQIPISCFLWKYFMKKSVTNLRYSQWTRFFHRTFWSPEEHTIKIMKTLIVVGLPSWKYQKKNTIITFENGTSAPPFTTHDTKRSIIEHYGWKNGCVNSFRSMQIFHNASWGQSR